MPVAQFVPVIGSGFDQTAAQQFQWQQFNRQQDADNFARANAAQRDYNNYLLQLNQLQRQDVATADQYAERADTLDYNRGVEAARRAEYARQFDVNTKLAEQDLKARSGVITDKAAAQKEQEQAYLDEIAQAAENIAPEYNSTRKAVDRLQSKALAQQRAVLKSAGNILAELPESERGMITYDGKRFKPVPMRVNDEKALGAANIANAKLADVVSDYAETTQALDFQQKYLADLTKQIGQYRLQVTQDGDNYFLVSPLHKGKKFGKILAEAKQDAAEAAPLIPVGIEQDAQVTFRMPSADELSAGGQSLSPFPGITMPGPEPSQFSSAPVPTAAFVPTASFNPSQSEAPGEVVSEGPGPVVFAPDRVSVARTLKNAPGVVVRGVNEFLSGPSGPVASRGLIPFAKQVTQAAIGKPEQWLEPVPPGRVRVQSPAGVIGTIPQAQLAESIKLGYKLFQ